MSSFPGWVLGTWYLVPRTGTMYLAPVSLYFVTSTRYLVSVTRHGGYIVVLELVQCTLHGIAVLPYGRVLRHSRIVALWYFIIVLNVMCWIGLAAFAL